MNGNVINAFRNLPAHFIPSTAQTFYQYTGTSVQGLANGSPVVISMPSNEPVDSVAFKVRASGVINAQASFTVTTHFYNGSLSGTALCANASGAPTLINAGFTNFCNEVVLCWDSVSKKMNGVSGITFADHARLASTFITNTQSGITDPSSLQFAISITFTGSQATNFIQLREFVLEYL